jgi:hypothetical protein
MAAREVIHFPFGAQLSTRPKFPVLPLPEPVAESPPRNLRNVSGEMRLGVLIATSTLAENGKGRTVSTDIYAELYLWNKNVDSSLRVLQRLEALGIPTGQTPKEYEIRLEELRSALNLRVLETMLIREQAHYWRLSLHRKTFDSASQNDIVQ